MSISKLEWSRLRLAAQEAASRAYCPYSKFQVGAAVLLDDGSISAGCNVENASFGLTICAERNAIFQAVARSTAPFTIQAVLVYTPTLEPTAPCGACRQVINEFGPEAKILCVCDGEHELKTTLRRMLPNSFGPRNLES